MFNGGGEIFVYGGGCGFCLVVVASFVLFFLKIVLARFFIHYGGWVCVYDGGWVFVLDFNLFVLF